MNEIDYILIQNKSRHMVKNSRAYHSAEIGSDNFPMLAHLQLKLKKPRPIKAVPRQYDVKTLTGWNDQVNDFELKLEGAFALLLDLDPKDAKTIY